MGIWSNRKGVTGTLLRVFLATAIISYLLYLLGGWIVVLLLSTFLNYIIGIGYGAFIALLFIIAVVHLAFYSKVALEKYLAWVAIVLSTFYFFMIIAA